MDGILPSEVARLVLGHLEAENCTAVARTYLRSSVHLTELRRYPNDNVSLPLKIQGMNLNDIIMEYCEIQRYIAAKGAELGVKLPNAGGASDKLDLLFNAAPSSSDGTILDCQASGPDDIVIKIEDSDVSTSLDDTICAAPTSEPSLSDLVTSNEPDIAAVCEFTPSSTSTLSLAEHRCDQNPATVIDAAATQPVALKSEASTGNMQSLDAGDESDLPRNDPSVQLDKITMKKSLAADEQRPHKCGHCGAAFKKRNHFNVHVLIHSDVKPYECNQCDARFAVPSYLKLHILRIHIKDFKCVLCDAGFGKQSILDQHMMLHNNVKAFRCAQCGARFVTRGYLRQHMGIHNDVKPFKCVQCDAGFRLRQHLRGHMLVHGNVKAFECIQCGARFKSRRNLIQHAFVHNDEKALKCNKCSAGFKSRRVLIQHMLVHSDVKPFKCQICRYSCRQRCSLVRHIRKHSGEEQ